MRANITVYTAITNLSYRRTSKLHVEWREHDIKIAWNCEYNIITVPPSFWEDVNIS